MRVSEYLTFLCMLNLVLINCQTKSGDECDEPWDYVQFIKKDIGEKVEYIIRNTIYEVTDTSVLEETSSVMLSQVMSIREALLSRISDIRKGEICIEPGQNLNQEKGLSTLQTEIMKILMKLVRGDSESLNSLKSISSDILRFKSIIGREIMRTLMLPQESKVIPESRCDECDGLSQLSFIIENVVECAYKNNQEDVADAIDTEIIVTRRKPGEVCMPPALYSMDLIAVTENIDVEIENLYNQLIIAIEDDTRQQFFQRLEFYKRLRDDTNGVITNLLKEKDDNGLRRTIITSMRLISNDLKSTLKKCQSKCGVGGCVSCASDFVYASIEKMNEFRSFFANSDDEIQKRELVRDDLMSFINENNEDTRNLLIKQANQEVLDDCDKDKLDVINKSMSPMWMLVNATIFSPTMGEIEVLVDAMVDQLDRLLDTYCDSESSGRSQGTNDPNCDWEEYEATETYLKKIDKIIQEALYKDPDDSKRMTALLGFVDIQGMLEARVKRLFEENMICPDEAKMIKESYMGQVNKCLANFLNPSLRLSKMTRRQRLSCVKELRDRVEDRMTKLLEQEVTNSLSGFESGYPREK